MKTPLESAVFIKDLRYNLKTFVAGVLGQIPTYMESLVAQFTSMETRLVVFSSGEKPADKSLFKNAGVPYFTKPIDSRALEEIAVFMASFC
jgi:hypothetical protein